MNFLAGGLWIIPLGLMLGAIYSFIKANKQRNSGSITTNLDGSTTESDDKMNFTEIGAFWFAVMLALGAIASLAVMFFEK